MIYALQMCEIYNEDKKLVESIIFKFLWNSKWVGNRAPDRIKRDYLKSSYANGGLKAPDIKALDNALKTKQFIRAMASKHQMNLVQKFLLEKEGYFEYHKNEYAKIIKLDVVTACYQVTTNLVTDEIRSGRVFEVTDNNAASQIRTNVIASTDIIEYFRRKRIPLVIHRFGELADQGVETLLELINEDRFPRNDRLQQCAREVLSFFPLDWIETVKNAEDVNSSITYEDSYIANKWQLVEHRNISVKGLKDVLTSQCQVKPYQNQVKFELDDENIDEYSENPFILARLALHAPKDRVYKYRILHSDIYCNTRMHRFKMVESPNCVMCPNVPETIKHVLWQCPRATRVWQSLNNKTRGSLGFDYITYNTIILGRKNPNMAMETMILWTARLLMSINREDIVSNEAIEHNFKTLFYYETKTHGANSKKFMARWGSLSGLF